MLSVTNLGRTYQVGKHKVVGLADATFEVPDASILCITGKSGCGKSTLLHQLGLLDYPTSGKILLDGEDVTRLPWGQRSRHRLRHSGYVFQDQELLPELTVLENIVLPALAIGGQGHRQRAKGLLERVGLPGYESHRPPELSTGQQQRVGLARGLINHPRIIFADEPTANLDTNNGNVVMELLVQFSRELGITLVYVTNDPEELRYADQIIYMSDGRIVERMKYGGKP